MSMLSVQCDELRELALWLDNEFYDAEATKVRDAADTIWQLRDDLQRANAAVQDAEHDESMAWDRVRKAEADNAELRELCAGLLTGYECGNGELCDGCSWNGLEGDCAARTKARELGVEVDA